MPLLPIKRGVKRGRMMNKDTLIKENLKLRQTQKYKGI